MEPRATSQPTATGQDACGGVGKRVRGLDYFFGVVLIQFLQDVSVEEHLLGALAIPWVKIPKPPIPVVFFMLLADVVVVIILFKVFVTISASLSERCVVPRVAFPNVFLCQIDWQRRWVSRYLDRKRVL